MFDRVIVRPKPSVRRTALIVATAAGHAAVLTALVLVAFWKIDKLPVSDNREIRVTMKLEQEPAGGPPPGARLKVTKPAVEPIKVKPPVPVQIPEVLPDPPVVATGGPTTGSGPIGGGGNNPDGDPDSTLVGDGRCTEEPCGEVEKPTKPVDPCIANPKAKGCQPDPVILPPNVGGGLRASGNEKIYPPDSVRVEMVHAGKTELMASIKVCTDTDGRVDSVNLKSTGYGAYDEELKQQIRQWRYRPYLVNGVKTPMCTMVLVRYRMTR